MFLYLTIYMQGVLDYSPLEAGLRFLPLTVLGFIVAPISGALSNRIPIRVLLGIGLAVVGVGLLLDARRLARLGLDDAAGRLPRRRRRHRHHQPGHRPGGDRRRPGGEVGDGIGDQLDLPPGRDRDRRRRARRDLPVAASTRSSPNCCRTRRRGSAKSSPRAARARSQRCACRPRSTPKAVHAADVAFVGGFNEIILIAAILSFVGAAARLRPGPLQRLRAADRRPRRPSGAEAAR